MIVDGKQRVLKMKAKEKLRLNQNEQKTGNTGCKVQIPSSAVKYEKKSFVTNAGIKLRHDKNVRKSVRMLVKLFKPHSC